MKTKNNLSTQVTEQDLADAVKDKYGVLYSKDGRRLLKCEKKRFGENYYSIKEGTELICENAFNGCEKLSGVFFPNGVTTIGNHAFENCKRLRKVAFPDSVTTIGDFAFGNCDGIETVTLGEGVTYMEDSAFTWSVMLSRFNVAQGNEHFRAEDDALYSKDMTTLVRCYTLANSFEIPRSVTRIAGFAFEMCQHLESITIPAGITEIGRGAFARCTHLIEFKVEDGNEYFCAKDGVLYSKDMKELICHPINIYSLKAFTVPESVVKIRAFAFENCWYLYKITINSGVTEIGKCAFDNINTDAYRKEETQIDIVCKEGEDGSLVKDRFRMFLPEELHGSIRIRSHNDYGNGE